MQNILSMMCKESFHCLDQMHMARVPPILMHLDYKVRLNDHSFVVGAWHSLIYHQCTRCVEQHQMVIYRTLGTRL